MPPAPDQSKSDSLIGSVIGGRYLIVRPIGRGGMGVVYEGVHQQLERAVAIKVLSPAWCSEPSAVERFMREARTATGLGHSNIVDIHDLGRLEDGRPYLVMPLLRGGNLAQLLEAEGPQSPTRVAKLLWGVADALDLIHAQKLVHRDIKPENLMVVTVHGKETVKILDFGLAALISSTERLTRQGAICGTPQYMAPETVAGDMPDARGDVYSLAVVAFELLTGHVPFDGPQPFVVLTKKLHNDPPPLSSMSDLDFQETLELVCAKALAIDHNARYPSASEFLRAFAESAFSSESADPDAGFAPTAFIESTPPERESGVTKRLAEGARIPEVPRDESISYSLIGIRRRLSQWWWVAVAALALALGFLLWPDSAAAPAEGAVEQAVEPPVLAPGEDRASAESLSKRGTSAFAKGDLATAAGLYRDATLAAPSYAPAWRGLGLANERMGRTSTAVRAYKRYLKLAPKAKDASLIRRRLDKLQR